jgi:restriction endonuclease Mrr
VQVKRYRNAIQVEQIRSLAGAHMAHGMTRGIFVTTSSFQSGAQPSTETMVARGWTIDRGVRRCEVPPGVGHARGPARRLPYR